MLTQQNIYRCPHCNEAVQVSDLSDGAVVSCNAPLCGKEFQIDLPKASPEPSLTTPANVDNHSGQDVDANSEETEEHEGNAFTHENEESSVISVYSSPLFRRYPLRSLGSLLLAVLGLVGFIFSVINANLLISIASATLFILSGGVLAYWWWKASRRKVTLTNTSVIVSEGLISDKTIEVHHSNLTNIDIYQPRLCKWLNSGSISFTWGPRDDQILFVDSVLNPAELVEQIRTYSSESANEKF